MFANLAGFFLLPLLLPVVVVLVALVFFVAVAVAVAALKFAFFDSFRGVFLPALPRDLVVAADIVVFPAWQSVKTLSKSSSRADWSRSTSTSQSQSQTQTQSQSQTQDRASKDVN